MKKIIAVIIFLVTIATVLGSALLIFDSRPQYKWQTELHLFLLRQLANDEPSCAKPQPDRQYYCEQLERQILSTTVRVELHGWADKLTNEGQVERVNGSVVSHATVVGERYLITHNHHDLPFTQTVPAGNRGLTGISLHTASGKTIVEQAVPESFTVVSAEDESVILDFGEVGGIGFFTAAGIPSAPLDPWTSLTIRPGMEVAQVNWDGETTFVDWVTVEFIKLDGEPAQLELANTVEVGASGGGIFSDGRHIANSWARNTLSDPETGEAIRYFTIGALNPLLPTNLAA